VKVTYTVDPDVMQCRIPPLTLQPLVENALRHGILPKEEGGELIIGAHSRNGGFEIFVKDTGNGMTQEQVTSLFSDNGHKSTGDGTGIGLKNVNARLTALYGKGLTVISSPQAGTTVSFTIPQSC
jgi:two-component system sensor histidine kinase LytS